MKVTSQITVDLLHPNVATLVYAKQADQQSRFISATLLEGSQPWTPPTGALAAVRYRKPDGTIGWYDTTENKAAAVTMSGNVAAIQLAAQALTVSGNVYIELELYTQSAEKLSSFAWILAVEASAVSDGEIESSDYFNVLTETLAEIVKALPNIQKADEYAQAAAQSATQAADSETAAKVSEQAAAASAAQAAKSKDNSAASAQSSGQSASAAQASAASAAASQQLAAANAQTASASAASAAESEENAEKSAQDSEAWAVGTRGGQAVPDSDETHNNNSKYWAEQAAAAAGGGVITFNGRAGTVVPENGDYTPEMVGAPTTEEFTALKTTVDGKQPATNDLEAETDLADGDFVPFYDTSASAGRKTLWSNIVAKIRTALFGSANGFLKANGSGVVSAESPIPVASGGTGATTAATARANLGALSSADGAVTRAKLAQDALYSPIRMVQADSNVVSSDVGATIRTGGNAAAITVTLTQDVSHAMPISTEIAFLPWVAATMKIAFDGVKVGALGQAQAYSSPTFTLKPKGMIAIKKILSDNNGDYWLLSGPVAEVAT